MTPIIWLYWMTHGGLHHLSTLKQIKFPEISLNIYSPDVKPQFLLFSYKFLSGEGGNDWRKSSCTLSEKKKICSRRPSYSWPVPCKTTRSIPCYPITPYSLLDPILPLFSQNTLRTRFLVGDITSVYPIGLSFTSFFLSKTFVIM